MYKYSKTLIKKYFEEQSFVDSNIASFNNFIEEDLKNIIGENKDIVPTIPPQNIEDFRIKFDKIWVRSEEHTSELQSR